MDRVLVSWIGTADCNAALGQGRGIGPVAQAVTKREFDRVVLLSNYGKESDERYQAWLASKTAVPITIEPKTLRSPTNLEDIYLAVSSTLARLVDEAGPEQAPRLTFHTSPGTGPMAAVWIILARSRYPAELLTSSPDHGVSVLEAPFELAAEFVTRQSARFEAGLMEIAEGRPKPDVAFDSILHTSSAMAALVGRAEVVAKLQAPVLLEGESGTGKELLARAIHQASSRKRGPFIAVNCGALPRELVQSSLFGHEKGAFTGAQGAHKGFFREAQGGTLFLDEIGELPLEQQVHLLRALQEKKVLPVGASREVAVDVRIVAATHRNLRDDTTAGRFREDLYYRLAMLVLRIPPLRDRKGDVPLLVAELLPRVAETIGARAKKLSPKARTLFVQHSWPGNVRELEGALARALAWSKGDSIDEREAREALQLDDKPRRHREVLGRPLGDGFSIDAVLDEVARHYFERAAEDAGGVKAKAAELLGFANYQTYDNRAKALVTRKKR